MQYRRSSLLAVCLFFSALLPAQQYPFVHYTPKDGLVGNQIRSIYQDSKGRLYFTSPNGLSIYDGARFINYTSQNGLAFDIVNCVMEMGNDSIWIVTNTNRINCLVNGKLKTLDLKNENLPVINNLCRDDDGVLYAATDQGLYYFDKNRFIKLPFVDTSGRDINFYINTLASVGNYLLVQRNNALLTEHKQSLYLYNKKTKKITAEIEKILSTGISPDGRIWVSNEKNIMSVDLMALKKGKIVLKELPAKFEKLKNRGRYFIVFDKQGNCWLGDQNPVLIKAAVDGSITSFTTASGLSMPYINCIFQDREGSTWIATNNTGLDKLVNSNFTCIEKPFGFGGPMYLSYNQYKDELLLCSSLNSKAVIIKNDQVVRNLQVKDANSIEKLFETPHGFYGIGINTVYKMIESGNTLVPKIILNDSSDNVYGNFFVDRNGTLLISGNYNLTAIVNTGTAIPLNNHMIEHGEIICRRKLNFYTDNISMDSKGNIWIATRANEIVMFATHRDDPVNYLEQKYFFSKGLPNISPRSIVIDKKDNIWIGSRSDGIYSFKIINGNLIQQFHLNTGSGLSENFIFYLDCDVDNNIWACSYSGLDKISIKDGMPVIENITKENNIYQSVTKVVFDKNNTTWGLVSNGLIKITTDTKRPATYSPALLISLVKSGKDTITEKESSSLAYVQNNLSFNFAATSFIGEKQIQYSYQLLGGSNDQWSEPSNSASVSFIDLHPGHYALNIKAIFPADRYPVQSIRYNFTILPPWWQTWWFRSIAGLFVVGIFIVGFKTYYRRKLEKQRAALEKQQAIEKERTRIATDMHDDLGAGLSRIKFLSQSILNKKMNDEVMTTELEKITSFSDEMSEKMGEIIWALNEKNDTLADLVAYTRSYAVEYLANHNIECEADTPLHLPGTFITGEIRRNIFLSVKECLHNIVKHAQATRVFFSVQLNEKVQIIIHDNGRGIDWNDQRAFSNGIQNIEKRMKDIRGTVSFSNNNGVEVSMTIPLNL